MVNLPEVPTRIVTTQIPQNNISASDIERPFDMIAGAMEKVGGKLHEGAVAQSQQEGQNAVYRDDQGNLKVDFRSNFTDTGRAYNAQAHQQYVAQVSNDIITQGTQLQQAANGDPAVFQKSWQAFSRGLVQNAPPLARGAVQIQAGNEGARLYDGVITQKLQFDTAKAKGAFDARKQQLEADMGSLAYNGGVDTPDFKRMQQEYRGIWEAQVANPRMAVSQQEAEIQISRASSVHMAEAVVGETQRTFARPVDQGGGIVAAEQAARKILTDPNMQLSLPERQQYFGVAMSEIRAQNAALRQERIMLMPQVRDTEQQLKLGQGIDDPSTYDLIKQLSEVGDGATATRLMGLQNAARHIVGFNAMGPADRASVAAEALRRPVAGGGPGYVDQVALVESGGDPNAQALTSSARGLGQFTKGTFSAFLADWHPELVGTGHDFRTDPGLSKEAIGWFAQQNGKALGAAGIPTTDANLYLAHFLGPQGAVDMLKASPMRTAASVNPAAAKANRSVFYLPDGSARSVASLQAWAQGKVGAGTTFSAPSGPRFTAEEIKAYQAGVTHDFEVSWPKIKEGLAKNEPPTAEELATLATQVAVVNKPEVREDVAATLEGYGKGYLLSQLPTGQAEQVTSAIRSGMGDGGYTQAQRTMLGALDQSQKATATALKDDPVGYAINSKLAKVPPPLDFNDPQSLPAALAARGYNAGLTEQRYGLSGVSALRPQETNNAVAFWNRATPDQKVATLAAMSNALPENTLKATLATIAGKGEPTLAFAGGLYAQNPQAAAGVVRGEALLQQNPKLVPNVEDAQNRYHIDPPNGSLPLAMFPPTASFGEARQQILSAVMARYADLSNTAGDTTQVWNQRRFTQSVNEITGGLVSFNGGKVVTPVYGQSQQDFDARMAALTDADLAGAVTAGGTPIRADDVRGSTWRSGAKLKSYADGRYLVQFGDDASPAFAMHTGPRQSQPDLFILDLRPRQ